MSFKSILYSILTIVVSVALIFVVALMFAQNIILGIVGVILWAMAIAMVQRKAVDAATGLLDRLFAKYVVPILHAIIIVGLILCVLIPGAFYGVFWFLE